MCIKDLGLCFCGWRDAQDDEGWTEKKFYWEGGLFFKGKVDMRTDGIVYLLWGCRHQRTNYLFNISSYMYSTWIILNSNFQLKGLEILVFFSCNKCISFISQRNLIVKSRRIWNICGVFLARYSRVVIFGFLEDKGWETWWYWDSSSSFVVLSMRSSCCLYSWYGSWRCVGHKLWNVPVGTSLMWFLTWKRVTLNEITPFSISNSSPRAPTNYSTSSTKCYFSYHTLLLIFYIPQGLIIIIIKRDPVYKKCNTSSSLRWRYFASSSWGFKSSIALFHDVL